MTSPTEEILSFLSDNETLISIRESTRLSYENYMTEFNQTCGYLDGSTKEMLCRSVNTLYRHMKYGERLVLCSHNSERKFRLVKVKVVPEQEEPRISSAVTSNPPVSPLSHHSSSHIRPIFSIATTIITASLSPSPQALAGPSGTATNLPPEENLDDNNGPHHLTLPYPQSGHSPPAAFTTLLTSTARPSLTTSHPVPTAQSSSPQPHLHLSRTRPAASTDPIMFSVSPRHRPPVSAQSSMLLRSQRPTVPPTSASQPPLPRLRFGIRPATANHIANPESSHQTRRILPRTFFSASSDQPVLTLSHFPHSPTSPVTGTNTAFLSPSPLALTGPSGAAFSPPLTHPPAPRISSAVTSNPPVSPLSHHSSSHIRPILSIATTITASLSPSPRALAGTSGTALSLSLTDPPPEMKGAATPSELRKTIAKIDRDMQRKLSKIKKKKKKLFSTDEDLCFAAKSVVLIQLLLSELPVCSAPLVVELEQVKRGVYKLFGRHVPFRDDESLYSLYLTMDVILPKFDLVHHGNAVHMTCVSEEEASKRIMGELDGLYNELKCLQREKDTAEEQLRS